MNKSQILNIIKKHSLKIYRSKNINKKSFDEIGADSLKIVEMIAELEDKLNIELSDRDLNKKAFKSVDNFIFICTECLKGNLNLLSLFFEIYKIIYGTKPKFNFIGRIQNRSFHNWYHENGTVGE